MAARQTDKNKNKTCHALPRPRGSGKKKRSGKNVARGAPNEEEDTMRWWSMPSFLLFFFFSFFVASIDGSSYGPVPRGLDLWLAGSDNFGEMTRHSETYFILCTQMGKGRQEKEQIMESHVPALAENCYVAGARKEEEKKALRMLERWRLHRRIPMQRLNDKRRKIQRVVSARSRDIVGDNDKNVVISTRMKDEGSRGCCCLLVPIFLCTS